VSHSSWYGFYNISFLCLGIFGPSLWTIRGCLCKNAPRNQHFNEPRSCVSSLADSSCRNPRTYIYSVCSSRVSTSPWTYSSLGYISGKLADFQGRGANPKNRAAYPLEEIKSIGLEVLRNLRDNPLPMPPMTAPPDLTEAQWTQYRYQCHFGAYHFAEAYMLYLP
jgi:hypothetical protein